MNNYSVFACEGGDKNEATLKLSESGKYAEKNFTYINKNQNKNEFGAE